MKPTRTTVCGLVLAFATGAGVLLAQGQAPQQQAEQKAPEVFCDGLSTGQLCLSNAPKVLKLDDAQEQRWTEAARQYNKAVDVTTKQFLEQSKPILSPWAVREHAEVVRHGFESCSQPGSQHAIEQQVTTFEGDQDPVSSLATARAGQRSRTRSGNLG
jgi:hypothetical protein